jgi:hypothetical protein
MSKVLIVAKTKMANDFVCVGGIDLDNKLSVRLFDMNGNHETIYDCPYNILEVWKIEYRKSSRPLPHSEDIKVISREKIETLKQKLSVLDVLNNGISVYAGDMGNIFQGKLYCTDAGSFYISQENRPNHSTCFWICDRNLIRTNSEKIRYIYQNESLQYIPFVGLEANPAQIIPQGTLIRLSLAHWWLHEGEKKCFLQLSGWY